jgi:hypothetical protein
MKYLLLPDGYFTWKLQAGNVIYQPWLLMLAVCCFRCSSARLTGQKKYSGCNTGNSIGCFWRARRI